MRILGLALICLALICPALCCAAESGTPAIATADLRVRDPFILADATSQTYYLYRQIGNGRKDTTVKPRGVEVFTSSDLKSWSGPRTVFEQPDDFWADAEVWAPEVHVYRGKFYLFVTFTANKPLAGQRAFDAEPIRLRGTQILVADDPTGPFKPFANQAHTPVDWMCLDGTFWVEDGTPWMIFCHEWGQITDGTMDLLQLAPDLSAPVGRPQTLFSAHSAPWVKNLKEIGVSQHPGYVTDGPFIYRTQTGKLLMIWSSFGMERYAIGIAESMTGRITGPWKQQPNLLFKADGGHGMIFRTFRGELMLSFHSPNQRGPERIQLLPLDDTGDSLRLKSP